MTQFLSILAGLAVVIGLGYVIMRPHWAVVIILVMFPLEQALQGYFPFLATNGKIVNASVGFLALFAIGTRVVRGERLFSGVFNLATIAAIGLYLFTWVGLLWSPSERGLDLLIFGIPYVVLLLFATQLLIDDVADFHRLAVGVMLVGSIIAALVMLNPATVFEGGRLTVDIGLYAGEASSNPLALATLGGLMAVLAILVQFEKPRPFHMFLRLSAFALGLGLAIQSGSRGQVLAAVVVGVAFYPLARRVASVGQFFLSAFGYAFLFLSLYVVFNLFVGDWNRDRWDIYSAIDVTGGRLDNVADLMAAYASEPGKWLFGLGTNAFPAVTGSSLGYVHNQPIEVLCELGLIGASLLIVAGLVVARAAVWLWRVYGNDPVKRGSVAALAGLVAFSLIISLKQGSITVSGPTSLMWWLVLARIAAHERRLYNERAILEWEQDPDGGFPGEDDPASAGDDPYGDYGSSDYDDGGYAIAR